MPQRMKWSFYGSSLVSAYWNGAATYYRGLIRALADRGHEVTFYEPDAYNRQENRDIPDPEWAKVHVYAPTEDGMRNALRLGAHADVIVKASGVGVLDQELESAVAGMNRPGRLVAFWDVDAPATLDRLEKDPDDPFHAVLANFDLIFTYGGGEPVSRKYRAFGAKQCVPIYNALDPTTHYRVAPDPKFAGTLGFLGNRLPDREKRVEEYFIEAAKNLAGETFVLGGSGWVDKAVPANLRYLGHIYTKEHNAFNSSTKAVLNLSRDSMASYGFSPATRVFEAAGAAACIITDHWAGIEHFLEPGTEILVARSKDEVIEIVTALTPRRAAQIGNAALKRISEQHTYSQRAALVERVLEGRFT
ncbi:MAG TPA: glycosyltransferase [Bdellovibrionota bacterium]|nr:glycosyltransferase [Bdellovibrionota bacterium]